MCSVHISGFTEDHKPSLYGPYYEAWDNGGRGVLATGKVVGNQVKWTVETEGWYVMPYSIDEVNKAVRVAWEKFCR